MTTATHDGVAIHKPMTGADWMWLAVPGIVWGTSFFFIAEALDAFSPALITPMRILLGMLTLAFVPAARVRLPREVLPRVALLALVWMAFPLSMFPFAEQRVSSSVTGMLNGATPLFVAGVASIIHRRIPSRAMLIGLLVGLFGVVLVAMPTVGEGSSSVWGVVMILAALASYGIALNMAVPLQQQYGSLALMWRVQGFALLYTVPLGVYGLTDSTFAWHSMLAMIALGSLGTALAYVIAANNAGRIGSTRASVTTYLIPVVALALGVLLRDEPVAAIAVVGCGVALLGAFLAGRSRH